MKFQFAFLISIRHSNWCHFSWACCSVFFRASCNEINRIELFDSTMLH